MAGAGPADYSGARSERDHEYEVEQHYGHSGITAWKENVHENRWLQDIDRRAEAEKDRCPALTLDSPFRIAGLTRLLNWTLGVGGQRTEVGGWCCSPGALSPYLNRSRLDKASGYSNSDIRDIRISRGYDSCLSSWC